MKNKFSGVAILSLSLFLCASAQAQSSKLAKYTAAETACDGSINTEKWESAEALCKKALTLSTQLGTQYKREKMTALKNYAFTLFSQYKFGVALTNFTKALNIGKTFLAADSMDLGKAYFNVARANQGMASITGSYIVPAETNYLMAEKVYRAAYAAAPNAETKAKAKESINDTLILLKMIAGMRGEDAKLSAINARIAELETYK